MDTSSLKILLVEVSHISRHYGRMAELSGGNFNIFSILKLQTSEVRAHSAFLAELLNSKGLHGQGDLFLKLFVQQFEIEDFDTATGYAEVERYTGPISSDFTQGGRIDILVTDGDEKHIIIENKIYAGDQKYQLLRYHNFDKKASLFYLNLFGDTPTDTSTGNLLSSYKYRVISYQTDIITWLERCQKEAVSLPVIRETIGQYANLLRSLTNQTTKDKIKDSMKEEVLNLLLKNPEYIDAFETCTQIINSLVWETKAKFLETFNAYFPETKYPLKSGGELLVRWGEDGDGIFFCYEYRESGVNASGTARGKALSTTLKEIEAPSRFYSNNNYIGWFFAKPIQPRQKFEHLDKKTILCLSGSELHMKEFVQSLVHQANQVTTQVLEKINS